MLYSASTNGFYGQEIHGDNVPNDVVEITPEYHTELLNGQSQGKVIKGDERGYPRLYDQEPPSAAEVQRRKNKEARAYLLSTDWYVVRRAETGEEVPQDILDKRAEARLVIVE